MKRTNKKLMGVICMAMAIFSVATSNVKVSAATLYDPTSKTEVEQPRTTTERKSYIGEEEDTTATTTSSYLTSEQRSILNKLGTDYTKVNWGVQYSPKGMDGIIISVAPYMDGRYSYLLVAVTNIYNEDVTFSASGYAKGKSGQEVAELSFYEDAIRPGNTIAKAVYCDSTPTGEIHWDEIELPKVYSTSASWEGDWTFSKDTDGYYQIEYNVESNDYMNPGYVTALLLDKNGYVVDVAYDYTADKGYYVSGCIQFFQNEFNSKIYDVAIFTNPLKTK